MTGHALPTSPDRGAASLPDVPAGQFLRRALLAVAATATSYAAMSPPSRSPPRRAAE
jgi:hypothetical protein